MTELEIWKDIEGYEGLYEVSNMGNVKSLEHFDSLGRKHNSIIRKPQRLDSGYVIISLTKNSHHKAFLLHRLVAKHFLPNPYNLPVINHKDQNPSNNCVDNLEWCTQSYNLMYKNAAKRAASKQYKPILQYTFNGELIKKWDSITEAAQYFNKSTSKFVACCKGKRKSAYGFIWCYASDIA